MVCNNSLKYRFKIVSEGNSHPVFFGYLVYKLRRVKDAASFVSSNSKIVQCLRHRKYGPEIIERTIGLVFGPSTTLYRSFLHYCTLTNKVVGTIWRDLSNPHQRRKCTDPRPLWLLVEARSALCPGLASSWAEHSLLWRMSLYILIYNFFTLDVCVMILWHLRFCWLLVLGLY